MSNRDRGRSEKEVLAEEQARANEVVFAARREGPAGTPDSDPRDLEPPVPETAPLVAHTTHRHRINRVTIDAMLAEHRPDADHLSLTSVQAVEHVKRVANALDQVASRTDRAIAEHGFVPKDVVAANDDDLAATERHETVLADAHAVVQRMRSEMRKRLQSAPDKRPSH